MLTVPGRRDSIIGASSEGLLTTHLKMAILPYGDEARITRTQHLVSGLTRIDDETETTVVVRRAVL